MRNSIFRLSGITLLLLTGFLSCLEQEKAEIDDIGKNSKPLFQLQQEFLDLRFGMFIHFNLPTYYNQDWIDPNAPSEVFNPVRLNCEQWAKAARSAGMTYGCLTTKHHSGFCIWDTKTTDYNVMNTSFKRDVVKEYVEAFRKEGLKVCLYYSILDTHHDIRKGWVRDEHTQFIKDQLTELLTNYGEITALTIDGWDAFWARLSYEELPFEEIYLHVKSLQPNCLIGEHNAGKYPADALFYTDIKHYEQNAGQIISRETNRMPAQAGIPINKNWFWKTHDPVMPVKDPDFIVNQNLIPLNDAYCNFILNVAPNRDGLIDENALEALAQIGNLWQHPGSAPKLPGEERPIIASNLAKFQKVSSTWSNDMFLPDFAVDDDFETAWQSNATIDQPWLEVEFENITEFNAFLFCEPEKMLYWNEYPESRIKKYEIQIKEENEWKTIFQGESSSRLQLCRFDPVKSKNVRLLITNGSAEAAITEICVYNE